MEGRMIEPTSTFTGNQPPEMHPPQPSGALVVLTYLNHIIIVVAAIAISQMSILVQVDPDWGVMLAERPWLKDVAIVCSAILGIILFRYSQWAKRTLGVHHRNSLLLLVLSAMLVWLLLTPLS